MTPIGSVRLRNGVVATLTGLFVWDAPDVELARLFNLRFNPFAVEADMPSAGIPFGRRTVAEAARVSGGVAEFPPLSPLPVGTCS